MTNDDLRKLAEEILAAKANSTQVVAWYAHPTESR